MSTEKNIQSKEPVSPAQQVKADWRALVEAFSYKAIVNNLPYLGYLALLCVLYIGNSHKAITLQSEINQENKNLKELGWKYKDRKSELLRVKTQSNIGHYAARVGLHSYINPAYKITK